MPFLSRTRRRARAILVSGACALAVSATAASAPREERRIQGGASHARSIAADEEHVYLFDVPVGQTVEATLQATTVTVKLQLESDEDGPIIVDRARVKVLVGSPSYRLVLRAERGPSADYELRLGPATTATVADGQAFEALRKVGQGRRLLEEEQEEATRRAQLLFDDALARYESLGDLRGQFAALEGLGDVWDQLGEMPKARAVVVRCLEVARRLGDPLLEADALSWIAVAEAHTGEHAAAQDRLRAALEIVRRQGDRRREGQVLGYLAFALSQSGSTPDGEASAAVLEEALPILVETGDAAQESSAHNNLGVYFGKLGDGDQALAHHERALAIRRDHGLKNFEGISLENIGTTLGDVLSRPAEALPYFEQALVVRSTVGDRIGIGSAYEGLCRSHHQLGRPREARPFCEKALVVYRDIGRSRGEANILVRLGEIALDLGELDAAKGPLLKGREIARAGSFVSIETQALVALARVALAKGEIGAARTWAETAVGAIENARAGVLSSESRASYFSRLRGAYDLYTDLLVRSGDEAGAFRTSERARSRTLVEEIAAYDRTRPPPTLPAITDLAVARSLLGSDTVLVEYQLARERSFAWVVTAAGARTVLLAPSATIEEAARRVVEHAIARNLAPREDVAARRTRVAGADQHLAEAARRLATLILAPLALPPRTRLAIVADGALHFVPFAALPDPVSLEPLLATREVVLLPSASALAALRTAPRPPREETIAIVADPVFTREDERVGPRLAAAPQTPADADGSLRLLLRSAAESGLTSLPRLRFSREEATAIAALVPEPRRLLFLDFDASRDRVTKGELSRARVVHFATHGILNSRHPALSGLVLSMVDAGGAARDGFLRLRDVESLTLGADLVVLSACQTALGKEVRGEGIVGLTRGFMVAGAPRVLASLWRVQDQATAELMTRFYGAYLGRGTSAAQALREAQQGLAADPRWRSPYFWAGFSLYGEWR